VVGLFVFTNRKRSGVIFHQSDLSAWARCPAQYGYQRAGLPRSQTSAIAYGVVMHHALHVLEALVTDGQPLVDALAQAIKEFTHYWEPFNIGALTDEVPPDGWIRGQGYSELRMRGIAALRTYADLMRFDQMEMLGLEYSFMVPVDGTWDDELGEPHILAGTVDRLAARYHRRVLTLCVDDYKTGKAQRYLQHNLQFTAYLYATTKREFWVGWHGEAGFGEARGDELFQRFAETPRRAFWWNMKELKVQDAGFRNDVHYARFRMALNQVAASVQAEIYPLTISGDACTYCEFRKICGGLPVPAEDYDPTEQISA
jgi:CRISPR/Cas system-associated exonuclease Cas4 (RecB family)